MVRKNRREEQVYHFIRQKILSGEWETEMKIIEREISETLQVSRSPIRRALQRLHEENLIDLIPYKGAFVAQKKLPRKEFVERLQLLEVLLINMFGKIEQSELGLPLKEMDRLLSQLEEAVQDKSKEQDIFPLLFEYIDISLSMQNNRYYYNLMVKLVKEIVQTFRAYISYPSNAFHAYLIASLRKQWQFCVDKDYIQLRKEIHRAFNHILTGFTHGK